jgi:hypothetical protein
MPLTDFSPELGVQHMCFKCLLAVALHQLQLCNQVGTKACDVYNWCSCRET